MFSIIAAVIAVAIGAQAADALFRPTVQPSAAIKRGMTVTKEALSLVLTASRPARVGGHVVVRALLRNSSS